MSWIEALLDGIAELVQYFLRSRSDEDGQVRLTKTGCVVLALFIIFAIVCFFVIRVLFFSK